MGAEQEVQRASQVRFDRVVERHSVRSSLDAYDREQQRVLVLVRKLVRGRGSEPIDPRVRRRIAARVRQAQIAASRRLAAQLMSTHAEAHAESLRGLLRVVGRMEGSTAAVETARFEALIARKVQRAVQRTAARQTAAVASAMDLQLRMAELEGKTTAAAVRDLERVVADQRWRIERVARTEASFAYNDALDSGIELLAEELPGLRARWTEHVNDSTWEPLDNRVAADSMALHGQVKRPGGVFVMPSDGPSDLVGKTYESPPNRPNDRAVLTPWRKEWGIPAYEVRDGRKVWLVRRG